MDALKPVRVGVRAPDSMAGKIIYALEELLTAARVPHRVERTETSDGWDLFYGDRSPAFGGYPAGEALWMAASRAAWRFFERPGARIEGVDTARVAAEWVRLPSWGQGRWAGDRGAADRSRPAAALPDLAAGAFFFLSRWEEWRARAVSWWPGCGHGPAAEIRIRIWKRSLRSRESGDRGAPSSCWFATLIAGMARILPTTSACCRPWRGRWRPWLRSASMPALRP